MDCDLMSFYQTYLRYCIFHKERSEAFKVARVSYCDDKCTQGWNAVFDTNPLAV